MSVEFPLVVVLLLFRTGEEAADDEAEVDEFKNPTGGATVKLRCQKSQPIVVCVLFGS